MALLREGQEVLQTLALRHDAVGCEVLVHRALIFRVYERFSVALPDPVHLLLRKGETVLAKIRPAGQDDAPHVAADLPRVYSALLHQRGLVKPEQPIEVPSFADMGAAKAHFRELMAALEETPKDNSLRRFLYLGTLAEFIVRAPLGVSDQEMLQQTLSTEEAPGSGASHSHKLRHLLRRIIS